MRGQLAIALFLLLVAESVWGGVFSNSDIETNSRINHTYNYVGATGPYTVEVCLEPSAAGLAPSLEAARRTWNELQPVIGNCTFNCPRWEDGLVLGKYDLLSVLVHEIGHCAFGFDHVNEETVSYTRTASETSISPGVDGIRGSGDDVVTLLPGARLIHWFRLIDNDPFVIDGQPIEDPGYSRVLTDLPFSDKWAASGNKAVGELLGYQDSQAVMYSRFSGETVYRGLTADETNMVRFAGTGLDELIGPFDDYTVEIVVVPDCSTADFSIRFEAVDPETVPARCVTGFNGIPVPGQSLRHYRVGKINDTDLPFIRVNSQVEWDFYVFLDGFESGTTAEWSATVP